MSSLNAGHFSFFQNPILIDVKLVEMGHHADSAFGAYRNELVDLGPCNLAIAIKIRGAERMGSGFADQPSMHFPSLRKGRAGQEEHRARRQDKRCCHSHRAACLPESKSHQPWDAEVFTIGTCLMGPRPLLGTLQASRKHECFERP